MNRYRRIIHHTFLFFLLFLFTAAGILPVNAERKLVRIGFYLSDKYGYTASDGNLTGYNVHLSKTVAMYGGFDAEMHGYDNVPEMEEALRSGEVDVLIDFIRTEQREKEFIFTNNPILEELVCVYSDNSPESPVAGDLQAISNLRIGYESKSGYVDYFLQYCAEYGFEPHMVEFNDDLVMRQAMETGETDACLTGSAVPMGSRVILSLPPLNSYMMLRADDSQLCRQIDSAISQLKTDDPDYISDLYHKYVVSRNTQMTPLTLREREYLQAHPELTVALIRSAAPFAFETGSGELDGIIPDYYNTLGHKLGITFRFISYDTTQEAIEAVANGETDILGHYYGNILIAERDNLYDTMEYGSTECARLTRSGFGGTVKTAAVTSRTAYLLADQLHSDIELKIYTNNEAGYQALMKGEVDAMFGSMTGVSFLINEHSLRGINLSILTDVTLGVRGAVSRDNTILLFILNKVIAVSGSAMNEAILENTVKGDADLRTAIENLPLGFSISVVVILLILVISLVVTLVLLARSSKERVAILNREMNIDGLTGAGSRRYGKELLDRELVLFRRYGEGPMIAMIDVDHFKGKNDTYGHEYGDFVLKKVVEVIRGTLRNSDSLIRWGGDEFILLCPHIHDNGAVRVLDKVIDAVDQADFMMNGKGEKITISLGASFFRKDDEDIINVLRRCDDALYKAKETRDSYFIYPGDPKEQETLVSHDSDLL